MAKGWRGIRATGANDLGRYERLAEASVLFTNIETDRAWQDYQAMLRDLYEVMKGDLLRGTVDKFGNNHDDEKRAVIHILTALLDYPHSIQREFGQAQKAKVEMEARRNPPGGLHGFDQLNLT